jgi:hypothetical protein
MWNAYKKIFTLSRLKSEFTKKNLPKKGLSYV